MLDRIKLLYLPYTVIDVGWWCQLSLPPLPSGRIQTKVEYALNEIMGDGEAPFAIVDKRDIGKYVARIIADLRTLNRMVFAYGEVWTQNHILDALEGKSGEKIVRQSLSKDDMENIISDAYKILATNPTELEALSQVALTQYKYSIGIRGDNTPEHAKYLGYLDAKELYPDVEIVGLMTFIREMLDGEVRVVYSAA